MRIIKIEAEANGAHANQNPDGIIQVPDGWAVIPENVAIPDSFPFVRITVSGGVVSSMSPGDIPPTAENQVVRTQQDDVDEMLIDHEFRLTMLELGV